MLHFKKEGGGFERVQQDSEARLRSARGGSWETAARNMVNTPCKGIMWGLCDLRMHDPSRILVSKTNTGA